MTRPSDREQRRAALDTTRSHHVESPAGSGKTLLLTMRFLKLLGEVAHPRDIVALTFTEKAAGEMRSRITGYLNRSRKGERPRTPLDEEILEYAAAARARHKTHMEMLTASDGLNIMTFHGFCHYIVRRAPLEAGVAPDTNIIDEGERPLLLDETVQRVMDRLFAQPPGTAQRAALQNRLLHHNNSWPALSSEMKEVIQDRDKFGDFVETIRETDTTDLSALEQVLRRRFQNYAERRLTELSRLFAASELGRNWQAFLDDLKSNRAEAGSILPDHLPHDSWQDLPAWRSVAEALLTKAGTPSRRLGPKSGYYAGFSKTEWGGMIAGMDREVAGKLFEIKPFPAPDEPITDMTALGDFIILAAEAISEYERLCKIRHGMDFVGLEQAALRALRTGNPSELHLYLDHRIGHLLIDEFQDTNRNQWELVRRLCTEWRDGDGKTIFIVGDPKQSIYAFRKAEVSLFFEARRGIPLSESERLQPEPHLLQANFRSSNRLVEWTNDLFGKSVMNDPDTDADEVPFSPSVPAQAQETSSALSLNLFADEDPQKAREKEAAWIAGTIKTALAESGSAQSIALLLFTRNRLPQYLTAFKEYGIPVQVQEGLRLMERPEAAHLLQMTRLLALPHDDLAWASLLRSPWAWHDRRILYETAMEEPESWREKIHRARQRHPELETVHQALDRAFRRLGRDPLAVTLQGLWEELEGPKRTAARYGMAGIANCRHFFEMLAAMEQGTPQETLRHFETTLDSVYEPTDPAASRSPVQIMTIHRAKGLEFDRVFLPFLDWKPLAGRFTLPPPYLSERLPGSGGEQLIAMAPDRRTDTPSPAYSLLKKLRDARRVGEAKRWFYVAATRARSDLFMSGIAILKEGCVQAPRRSILEWVMSHESVNGAAPSAFAGVRDTSLPIRLNPVPDEAERGTAPPEPSLPEASPFVPERIPYRIDHPSASGAIDRPPADTAAPSRAGRDERIRGIVLHRILQTAQEGNGLPAPAAVEKALYQEGMPPSRASEEAPSLLDDVMGTLGDPFIARFMKMNRDARRSEWAIEDLTRGDGIRSGTIDLAVEDGTTWWIIDFKTARPTGESTESFIDREVETYRSQLSDYRSMVAGLTGTNETSLRVGLYFTALRLWKEVD